MGVKGLTTYIAKNAKKFLMPHELHDCNLVIDGDNLACQLFKKICTTTNCAFGGDYDMFYMQVCRFFILLDKCNVKSYVLLDGGYEEYRLRTVHGRLRSKIASIKHIDPSRPDTIHFPLLIREVFVRALKDMGINVMRCLFEADEEVANLARRLDCPVLSYDSDFYIYNVLYIPFVSLTFKVYKKTIQRDGNQMIRTERCSMKAKKRNRKARVPIMDIDGDENEPPPEDDSTEECYYYLDCCLYQMENLLKYTKLTEELLPFFGAIVGNDFTEQSKLKKFYSGVSMRRKKKDKSKYQRQIDGLIQWLQHESLSSALEKLEVRYDKASRENILDHIATASAPYSTTKTISCTFFGFEQDHQESVEEIPEEDTTVQIQEDNENHVENDEDEDEDSNEETIKLAENPQRSKNIPFWLKEKFLRAELPRYCIDLIHLKMYVNNPQIENYKLPDANLVALDILLLLFRILNAPETPTLNYLTRLPGQVTYANKYLTFEESDAISFDPAEEKNEKLFHYIFRNFENHKEIFNLLPALDNGQKIYFLAMVYWTKKSKLWTWLHIRSLILSMMILSFIDRKCGEIRTQENFDRVNGKNLAKIKAELSKKCQLDENPVQLTESKGRQMRKKISKNECVLIQERILPFLSRNVHHKKSYTGFSSTVLHGFSEFQAVLYHMISLNSISNFPFEEPHVAKMYKGFLLFNLYTTLNKRDDPEHYLRDNLLKCAHNFWSYYNFLMTWLLKFIPQKNVNIE